MRKTIMLVASSLILLGVAGLAEAQNGAVPLRTDLNGEEEVTAIGGDPDGTGQAQIIVNLTQSKICYSVKVRGIDPATMAHIHVGAEGTNGPVVVGLTAPTNGSSAGCVSVNPVLAAAIANNPANYYVNVHNAAYRGGALRGQLGD